MLAVVWLGLGFVGSLFAYSASQRVLCDVGLKRHAVITILLILLGCRLLVHLKKPQLFIDEVSRVMLPTLERAAPVPLLVPGHGSGPLHGNTMNVQFCVTVKAPCFVRWSESERIAVLSNPKAGSTTLGWLFEKTFEDAKLRKCKGLPNDTVVGVFFRDPVERFFSGYDEAVYRCVKGEYNKRNYGRWYMPAMIHKDIEGYNDWHKYWEGSKTATQTFHDYVLNGHMVERPFNTHMHQQSSRVAGLERIDWVGNVSDYTKDWAEFLAFARVRSGHGSLATTAPEEVPKKRENKWRHIFPAKTPTNVMKKICEHLEQDFHCLGLQSRWCSY